MKARLIFPTPKSSLNDGEVNWEGCEFSKSGRTDKGVSAFGQVVGIKVRSNRPLDVVKSNASDKTQLINGQQESSGVYSSPVRELEDAGGPGPSSLINPENESSISFDHINDEIPYPQILNRLLPPDIRILAWCPSPPADFSARFSCRERRYKYFFTNPAFTPTYGSAGLCDNAVTATVAGNRIRQGWLDIEAMREAAKKFVGLHDFRNFCKVDPSKQTDNFQRRIFHADIEEIDLRTGPVGYVGLPGFEEHEHSDRITSEGLARLNHTPRIFTFTLHGSAFLWHQVRCMAAILFLIGQGLELPNLVDRLLDVQKIPGKPTYEMAEDAPLVLWDCIFPQEGIDNREDALEWVYVGDDNTGLTHSHNGATNNKRNGKHGLGGVVDDLWKVWRQRKMDEILAGTLLDVVAGQGHDTSSPGDTKGAGSFSQKVFQGGNSPRLVGASYIPVLMKPRLDPVEDVNARYAGRKGFERQEEIRERGSRSVLDARSDDLGD